MIQDTNWAELAKTWAPIVITGFVAGLQLFTFRWQRRFNDWQSDLAERQHRVDVRKFRMSLLDKRLAVLENITTILAELFVPPPPDDRGTVGGDLFSCLLAGRTLYNESIAARLEQAWHMQLKYHDARLARIAVAQRGPGNDADHEAEDLVGELRRELFSELEALREAMIDATRVVGPVM